MDSYNYSFTEFVDGVSPSNRIDADYIRRENFYILEGGELWHRAQTTYALSAALRNCQDGNSILVELVPEPEKPLDPTAVAVDFRDSTVGYLSPTFAAYWHPVILALNATGRHACAYGFVDNEGEIPTVILDLPQWGGWGSVAADALYDNGFAALWANLSEISRTVLLDTFAENISPTIYNELRSNAHLMPNYRWNDDCHAVPFPILHAIRQEANRERVIRRNQREQAKQYKLEKRVARRQRAYEMHTAGMIFADIAQEFGLSEPTASALYREYLANAENVPLLQHHDASTDASVASTPPEPSADADSAHPLFGQTVVITGALGGLSKEEAWAQLAKCGARVRKTVTRRTSVLVVGTRIDDSGRPVMTEKHTQARHLCAAGQQIAILNQQEMDALLTGDRSIAVPDLSAPSKVDAYALASDNDVAPNSRSDRRQQVRGRHFTAWVEPVKQLKREERFDEALELLHECIDVVERPAVMEDGVPDPWYTEQASIVYRKRKDFVSEIAILQRWIDAASCNGGDVGDTHPLVVRRVKARSLLAKWGRTRCGESRVIG